MPDVNRSVTMYPEIFGVAAEEQEQNSKDEYDKHRYYLRPKASESISIEDVRGFESKLQHSSSAKNISQTPELYSPSVKDVASITDLDNSVAHDILGEESNLKVKVPSEDIASLSADDGMYKLFCVSQFFDNFT